MKLIDLPNGTLFRFTDMLSRGVYRKVTVQAGLVDIQSVERTERFYAYGNQLVQLLDEPALEQVTEAQLEPVVPTPVPVPRRKRDNRGRFV